MSVRPSKHMDQAIDVLERVVKQVSNYENPDVSQLTTLYKDLKKTKSMRLFLRKLLEVTEFLKSGRDLVRNVYDAWIIVLGALSECYSREVNDSHAVSGVLSCLESWLIVSQTEFCLQMEIYLFVAEALSAKPAESRGGQLRPTCFVESYFLHHANEHRLKLYGQRFVSLFGLTGASYFICDAARTKPNVVLTVLQYGGRLSDRRKVSRKYVPDIFMVLLSSLINQGVQYDMWDKDTLEFYIEPSEKIAELNLCVCFRAVLQDTVNPHEATFYLAGKKKGDFRFPELEKMIPFYDTLFPGCLYGRRIPPSLSHMCRYLIRKCLYDSWKLPDGIRSLPLPAMLKDYLNLLHD